MIQISLDDLWCLIEVAVDEIRNDTNNIAKRLCRRNPAFKKKWDARQRQCARDMAYDEVATMQRKLHSECKHNGACDFGPCYLAEGESANDCVDGVWMLTQEEKRRREEEGRKVFLTGCRK